MNKKLLALLAVAAVGVSVAGATPQTQFNKGELVRLILKQKLKLGLLMQSGTLMAV